MMRSALTLMGFLGVMATSLPAWAQDAQVSVTHGINGEDLALSEALPVDVAVDGACVVALEGLAFGETRGPLPLPAPATYNVEVFLKDGTPCGGVKVIDRDISVLFGQSVNIVAHLNSSGQPSATAFNTNTVPTGNDNTRLAVQHGAAAGMVDVIVRRIGYKFSQGWTRLEDLKNGEQQVADLPADTYKIRVRDAISRKTVLGPLELPLNSGILYSVFAVGSPANGTFDVLLITNDAH